MFYQYDLAGRRTRITWPDAYYADYHWRPYDHLGSIRENGATTGSGVLAIYLYDDLGRLTFQALGNGVNSGYYYDPVSRLALFIHDAAGTGQDTYSTFTYNPAS